ncbi:hypothetical protein ACE1AT_19225 [Pelatocladus sp. BLCC-F211]|uniref:hypothetical protein n=1 Tax=Pelatocladus sp. BLCC-F211 TaxID=3342752 RepID=UPI0035BB9B6E
MLRRIVFVFISLFLNIVEIQFVQAQTQTNQQTQTQNSQTPNNNPNNNTKPGLEPEPDLLPRAIRLSIVNGVIEYLQNTKRVTIGLEWSLLPADEILLESAREYYEKYEPVTCSIRNDHLGKSNKWIENLSEKCQQRLREALMVSDLKTLNSDPNSQTKFQKYWNPEENGDGVQLVRQGAVTASEYFGLLRDNIQITNLLKSNGISYSFDVSGATPQGQFPRISDQDITWDMKIYRFAVARPQNQPIYIYRFVVKAIIEPFNLTFVKAENTKADLNIAISFKKGEETVGLSNLKLIASPIPIEIQMEKGQQTNLKKLEDAKAFTQLNTALSFFGSPDLSQIVSNNFLGGTSNTSIITGGLINDKVAQPIVGVNLDLLDLGSSKAGGLLGIGITDSNSLYIGPSFQYSILTLSAGARIFDKKDSTRVEPAGVISFDLSQVIGGKQQNEKIDLDKSKTGGDWGKASEEIVKDLALVDWGVTQNPNIQQSLALVREKDCTGNKIQPNEYAELPIKITAGEKPSLKFIPQGIYKYQGLDKLPLIYALHDDGVPVDKNAEINFCSTGEQPTVQRIRLSVEMINPS